MHRTAHSRYGVGAGRAMLLAGCALGTIGCRESPRRDVETSASVVRREQPVTSADTTAAAAAAPAPDSLTPSALIRRYYAAIDSGNYAVAYELWGQRGQASGQTRQQFAAGFAQTASVRATIGDSVRLEGAAGSQYATVPVVIDAALRSGERQHFTGNYILRRAIVDGATAEQRQWHIYKAELRQR